MLTLLLTVLILGVIAYGVNALPIAEPFKTIAYCVIAVYLLLVLFRALGVVLPNLG